MRVRTLVFVSLAACLLLVVPSFAQQGKAGDSVTGSWTGTWGPNRNDRNDVTVVLKWDGKALTGDVDSEGQTIPINKGTFDAKTGTVHMEADAKGRGGQVVHYVIEGKVDNKTMSGSWNHDNRQGDFKITKK
jgi:hypothetical protein